MRVSTQLRPLVFSLTLLPLSAAAITGSADLSDTASLYEEALMQFNSGEVATSVIHLKNALQADPSFLAGHILLGRSYLKQGYAALAEKEFNQAIRMGADNALVIEYLAQSYLLQMKFHQLLNEIYPGSFGNSLNAAILVARGKANFQLGKLDEAALEFQDVRKFDPQNVPALLGLATVQLRKGEYQDSDKLISLAATLEPGNPSVWYTRGALHHGQAQFEESVQFYSRALELAPDHYQARLARAGVYMDRGNYTLAKIELDELYLQSPENPQVAYLLATTLLQLEDRPASKAAMLEAKSHLESLSEEVVQAHGPTLFLAALVNYDLGTHEKAKVYLESFISRYRQDPRARVILGTIYLQEAAYTKVIETLEPVLEITQNNYRALVLLGDAYMFRHKYFKASQMFDRAAQIAPTDSRVLTRGGLNELLRGHEEAGWSDLKRALDSSPRAGMAGLILVVTLLKEGHTEQALEFAEKLRLKSPENPLVVNLLAAAQAATGNGVAARQSYSWILQRFPEFYPARVNLAKLDLVEGNLTEAEQQFTRLMQERPENILLMVELSRVSVRRGDFGRAIQWLEKAHGLDSGSMRAGTRLVDLYIRTGKAEKAKEVARKLISRNGDNIGALIALGRSQLATGQQSKARVTLKSASQQSGLQSELLPEIAEYQYLAGDLNGALYTLEKFVSIHTDQISPLIRLTELQLHKKQFDKVAEGIARIESAGFDDVAERLKGDLKTAEGDGQLALEHYLRALELRPGTNLALRAFKAHLALKQDSEALAFVEHWIKKYPQDRVIREVLAQGYLRNGQLQKAREEFERLLSEGGSSASLLNNLAVIYHRLGDPEAFDVASKAYEMDPDSSSVNDTLGWILVQQGRASDGLKYLRSAFARSSSDSEIRYHIAAALMQLGRQQEALGELKQALEGSDTFVGRDKALRLYESISE